MVTENIMSNFIAFDQNKIIYDKKKIYIFRVLIVTYTKAAMDN
jgi:hypothetical protein